MEKMLHILEVKQAYASTKDLLMRTQQASDWYEEQAKAKGYGTEPVTPEGLLLAQYAQIIPYLVSSVAQLGEAVDALAESLPHKG